MPDPIPATTPTLRLQHILVPYDFSEGAKLALHHAIAHAQHFQSNLTLLHVVHLPFRGVSLGAGEPHAMEGMLLAEATKQLTALIEELKQQNLTANSRVRPGYPAPEIVEVARQELVDLIIMGTHGRTGFKHTVLGSVAENVVRHAPCPVLVVREPKRQPIQA